MLTVTSAKPDGQSAAPSVVRRKRAALFNTMDYAVERKLLMVNPSTIVKWKVPKPVRSIDKQHYMANQLVEISGDEAVCESYYCCYIEFVDDPEFTADGRSEAVIMGGRHVDRLARVGGDWKISSRVSVVDWSRSLGEPAHWSSPAAAQFTKGRGDDHDPATSRSPSCAPSAARACPPEHLIKYWCGAW